MVLSSPKITFPASGPTNANDAVDNRKGEDLVHVFGRSRISICKRIRGWGQMSIQTGELPSSKRISTQQVSGYLI